MRETDEPKRHLIARFEENKCGDNKGQEDAHYCGH